MDRDSTVDLLKAILADIPRLAGARCIGRDGLYDPYPDVAPNTTSRNGNG